MHLSAPRRLSINDGIDLEENHLRYKKIDNAIVFVKQTSQGCCMAKMDLKHAFRLCPIGGLLGRSILRRQVLAFRSMLITSTI